MSLPTPERVKKILRGSPAPVEQTWFIRAQLHPPHYLGVIVCDIADQGVSQVVLTRLIKPCSRELSQRLNSSALYPQAPAPGP